MKDAEKSEWRAVCKNPHCILTALLKAKRESLMTEEEIRDEKAKERKK